VSKELKGFLQHKRIENARGARYHPMRQGKIERFNRTYREDVLDAYLFNSLDEARRITFGWLEEYNSISPHASLGNKTPYEFSARIESVYL